MGSFFFGHLILFPATFEFLMDFGGPDMRFLPMIDEYWSFYSWSLLGLGLVFQTPVIIFVLAPIGLVTPRLLLRGWQFAVLGSFVVAAVVTPSTDMVNQTALALSMIGLYFLGVGVAWLFGKPRRVPMAESETLAAQP
jgi:sec-independent protein translocase protein TatC